MSCSPYFNLNTTTEEMENKLLSMGDLFDRQNDSAKNYDTAFLSDSLTVLTKLIDIVKANPDQYSYPMVVDRLNTAPISSTEYADFLIATGTEQSTVENINEIYLIDGENYLTVGALQYLQNMNSYYTDNFASDITGGICGLYTMFSSWLDKVKANLNLLMGLLNIETLIKQLIETIKNKIMAMINQLIGQISNCLGSIAGISESVKNISNFFSDTNINSLKDTVKIAIADIASKFEIPQTQTDPLKIVTQELEATQYLLYRLCQFTTAIEDFLMAPYHALQDAIANCKQVGTVLTNISNQFALEALTAGAFRMGDENIDAVKRMLGSQLNTMPSNSNRDAGGGAGTSGGATPSNYWTSPFTDDEKAVAVELVSATKEQIQAGGTRAQQYLQFQSNVINQDDPYPGAGVKELQPSIIIIAIRIAKTLGTKLIINSGYRSPGYNAAQPGSAKNSYHMKGLAMDCSRTAYGSDFASGERFIKIASQEGIGGIGTYPTFIHIDTGPRRSWTTIDGQTLGHDNARALHKQDKFRNGL